MKFLLYVKQAINKNHLITRVTEKFLISTAILIHWIRMLSVLKINVSASLDFLQIKTLTPVSLLSGYIVNLILIALKKTNIWFLSIINVNINRITNWTSNWTIVYMRAVFMSLTVKHMTNTEFVIMAAIRALLTIKKFLQIWYVIQIVIKCFGWF